MLRADREIRKLLRQAIRGDWPTSKWVLDLQGRVLDLDVRPAVKRTAGDVLFGVWTTLHDAERKGWSEPIMLGGHQLMHFAALWLAAEALGRGLDAKLGGRITRDPRLFGGKPCIRGLRMPVHVVLSHLVGGATPEELLRDFPDLEPGDIQAALAHAARLAEEEG